MTKVFFGVTFEISSSTTWEKAVQPNALSQHRDDLLVFTAKIICYRSNDINIPLLSPRRDVHLWWFRSEQPIFSDIYVTPLVDQPRPAERLAQSKIALVFWEEAIRKRFQQENIPYDRQDIEKIARIYRRISWKNDFLPQGLTWAMQLVYPWFTQSCDWEGTRKRITKISPLERWLYPSYPRHRE